MVHAYHVIFGTYGFWLPNDPRGSWSDFIASWELFHFGGPATRIADSRSRDSVPHDRQLRLGAKKYLRYPAVTFDGLQANAVANGFAKQAVNLGYVVFACSIMPEHVHMVIARHTYSIEKVVRLLKRGGTESLKSKNLHPLQGWTDQDGSMPTPWARKCWKVFLNDATDICRAITYVEQNPLREGKRRQSWRFVKDFTNVRHPLTRLSEDFKPRLNGQKHHLLLCLHKLTTVCG